MTLAQTDDAATAAETPSVVTIIRKPAKWSGGEFEPLRLLMRILSYKRPFDSDCEEQFARDILDPLGCEQDSFRNRFIKIGAEKTIWSSHIDTCHHTEGYQKVGIFRDGKDLMYAQALPSGYEGDTTNCLGADDGAGVFLLIQMILAKRPGLYLFHRGEERGCLGSRDIKDKRPHFVSGYDRAIALDRRDFNNIITHQSGTRGASQAFASALASKLNESSASYGWKPDDTGAFTDTHQYFSLVPECTNLSVGYQSNHGPLERQYIKFILHLRQALLAIDFADLPTERDPTKTESKYQSHYTSTSGYKGGRAYDYSENWRGRFSGGDDSAGTSEPTELEAIGYIKTKSGVWMKSPPWNDVPDSHLSKTNPAAWSAKLAAIRSAESVFKPYSEGRARVFTSDNLAINRCARDADLSLVSLIHKYPQHIVNLLAKHGCDHETLLEQVHSEQTYIAYLLEKDAFDKRHSTH